MPLMIVAGDHARNDLAGAEADSWDSILKADGFETEVIMKGLGEIDAIAEMFVKHLKKGGVFVKMILVAKGKSRQ